MSILTWMMLVPLAGSLIILCLPKDKTKAIHWTALASTGLNLALGLVLFARFDRTTADIQFIQQFDWVPAFNIQYFVGVDGLSVTMVILTAILAPLCVIASLGVTKRIKEYFFWLVFMEVGMIGVFVALDFFLFYVFWEIGLVPMYFLIGVWGGPRKEYAAIKFFLYTLFGSVFMLLGMIALYFLAPEPTLNMLVLRETIPGSVVLSVQIPIFLAMYLGFAIKVPAFPFHTWLPLAHVEAPTAASAILAGIMLKMGVYGLLRIAFPMLPLAAQWFLPFLVAIGVINIVYGALCAMAQRDIKKMVAYSSVSHMGYCLLGIAAVSADGFNGAVYQMIAHGVVTASLFFLVGVIYDRAHTRDIEAFGGLGARVPIFTGLMIVQVMASLGMPLLAGFWGEFLCLLGAFVKYKFHVAISVVGILATAAFFLRMIQKVFLGPLNEKWKDLTDMSGREYAAIVPLVVLTVLLGVWPALGLDMINATMIDLASVFQALPAVH